MVFLGIYRATYDYAPQSEGELGLTEGDLLMVLEKSGDDDWWKAKKKVSSEDEDEPEGLIPNNYVEEVSCNSIRTCRISPRASLELLRYSECIYSAFRDGSHEIMHFAVL